VVAADEGSLFLADLVRAMRSTASLERARIGEDTDRRRQAHIDHIRAAEASAADRVRELAGEDLKAIEAWADGETKRIQLERERRENELNQDLETSLAGHRAKMNREVEGVETTIATYRAEVDAFFEGLDRETEPIRIAQQAMRSPGFPKLEAAGEPSSATELRMVGVMDAVALARRIGSLAAPSVASPERASTESSHDVDQSGEAGDAASVTAATGPSYSAGTLLEAVPAARPMSWLRRGANDGDEDRLNRQD
jgi:hypothetical protein